MAADKEKHGVRTRSLADHILFTYGREGLGNGTRLQKLKVGAQ